MRGLVATLVGLAAIGLALGIWLAGGANDAGPGELGPPPERVILFAPNLTEAAAALGHGERVVGVTDFCVWPFDLLERPRIGGMIDPNLERIAALDPDLLVVQGRSPSLRAFARSNAIPLAGVKMDDDLDSIFAGIARVDSLLGGDAGGALVASIRDELDALRAEPDGERPRVLLSLGHDPRSLENLYAVGSGSFLGELLWIVGARNQHDEHERNYFLLSLETLVADPPDVVLELRPGAVESPGEREELLAPWAELGVDGLRVAIVRFDGALIPGPRIAETARALAGAIASAAPAR